MTNKINLEYLEKEYNEYVTPLVMKATTDRFSRNHAKTAAVALYSFIDYIKQYNSECSSILHKNEKIQRLGDIANAVKHHTRYGDDHLIKTVDQITQTDLPGIFDAPFGQGYFAEASFVAIQNENIEWHEKFLYKIIEDAYYEIEKALINMKS